MKLKKILKEATNIEATPEYHQHQSKIEQAIYRNSNAIDMFASKIYKSVVPKKYSAHLGTIYTIDVENERISGLAEEIRRAIIDSLMNDYVVDAEENQ